MSRPHRRNEFSAVATAALTDDAVIPETVVVPLIDPEELLSMIVALDKCVRNLTLISAAQLTRRSRVECLSLRQLDSNRLYKSPLNSQ